MVQAGSECVGAVREGAWTSPNKLAGARVFCIDWSNSQYPSRVIFLCRAPCVYIVISHSFDRLAPPRCLFFLQHSSPLQPGRARRRCLRGLLRARFASLVCSTLSSDPLCRPVFNHGTISASLFDVSLAVNMVALYCLFPSCRNDLLLGFTLRAAVGELLSRCPSPAL